MWNGGVWRCVTYRDKQDAQPRQKPGEASACALKEQKGSSRRECVAGTGDRGPGGGLFPVLSGGDWTKGTRRGRTRYTKPQSDASKQAAGEPCPPPDVYWVLWLGPLNVSRGRWRNHLTPDCKPPWKDDVEHSPSVAQPSKQLLPPDSLLVH